MAWLLSFGACATMFAPGPDTVLIQTDPAGAEILLDGRPVGQTPTHIAVSRNAKGKLSLQHPAHPQTDMQLTTTLNGPVLLNLVFPGLLGFLIDAAGGNCTRWVPPGVIRLPQAKPSAALQANIAVATAADAPSAPEEATETTDTSAQASPQPQNQSPQQPLLHEKPDQSSATDTLLETGFFVTPTGFGLFAAATGSHAASSLEEIAPARGDLPSVRKADGKTAFLALASDVPAAGSSVYFLDRSGSLAEGLVVDSDPANGALRLSTRESRPPAGSAIVDRRGNVVGAAIASQTTPRAGVVEFEAVSCVSLRDLLRTCPTVTRPMPAASRKERSVQQIEAMLKGATPFAEAQR